MCRNIDLVGLETRIKPLENYRPVSTLAVFGKIFEKIIYNRLYSFFQSQNTLYENQKKNFFVHSLLVYFRLFKKFF